MLALEFDWMYQRIVAERKSLYLPAMSFSYSSRTDKIMKKANETVDKIMEAIKVYVENPSTQLSFSY